MDPVTATILASKFKDRDSSNDKYYVIGILAIILLVFFFSKNLLGGIGKGAGNAVSGVLGGVGTGIGSLVGGIRGAVLPDKATVAEGKKVLSNFDSWLAERDPTRPGSSGQTGLTNLVNKLPPVAIAKTVSNQFKPNSAVLTTIAKFDPVTALKPNSTVTNALAKIDPAPAVQKVGSFLKKIF